MTSKIKQFIFQEPDVEWFLLESCLPWLKLNIDVPAEQMYEEAIKLKTSFTEYRETNSKGWKSLCIHGITSNHIYDYTHYDEYKKLDQDSVPYQFTEISNKCPVTVNFLKKAFFNTNFFRVRYMLLEPGGYIEPHVDMPKKTLAPINIALNNPENCIFKMKGFGYVPFSPGQAFMLDTSNEHIVYNGSNEPRIHLIVHCNYKIINSTQRSQWAELLNDSLSHTLALHKRY